MASVVINNRTLNVYAKPAIDNCSKYISQARNNINKISYPSDFIYRTYVKNSSNTLLEIDKSVKEAKIRIDNAITNVNSINNKIIAKTGQLKSLVGNTLMINATGAKAKVAIKTVKNLDYQKLTVAAQKKYNDFIKKISEDFKKTKATVVQKTNSLWNSAKKVAKKIFDFQADLLLTAGTALATPFTSIWDLGKGLFTGDWNFETTKGLWSSATSLIKAEDTFKRVGASIANGFIALTKGLAHLGEALLKFLDILNSAKMTLKTGYVDIIRGLTTGDWDWKVTKQLWDRTKARVSKNYVDKAFDWFYNTQIGKTLDEYAYEPFKSDGVGCQILDGVGYATGIIVVSVLTFGAATPGFLAITATASGIGKYTSEEWNKNTISLNYNGCNLDVPIDYQKYSQIEKLKEGESTIISHTVLLEDGTTQELKFKITGKGNGLFQIVDMNGNIVEFNELKESSTVKGLGIGTIKGGWEGLQYYVGGKIGTGSFSWLTKAINNPIGKTLIRSSTRVVLDTITGAVEVPFQSLVTMLSEGVSWNEAWQKSGGWNAVKTQSMIAGLMSFGGEVFDLGGSKFFKGKNKTDVDVNAKVNNNDIDLNGEYKINNDISKKYKNAEQLYEAYISGKTKMNMKEYAEAMDFFKVRDNISLKNKTGMTLEELFFDDDYIIGVHRAGNGNTESILDNGLYLTGHQSSGAFTSDISLNRNITFHDDYFGFIKALSEGSSYKTGGVGYGDAIIVKIPKADINNFDKIIDISGTTPILKSDYLVGNISSYIGEDGKIHLMDVTNVENNTMREINGLALSKYSTAKNAEPKITSQLQSFEDETSKLVGLEHRFKTPDSLARKIESDSIADNVSYEQAVNNIGDSLRYTLQVDDSNYTNKVVSTLKELEGNGYKINKFKNFWGNEKYQGINVSIISPEGFKMELQIHTESSFYTKEILNHKYYEIERSITSTEAEKEIASQIMRENQSKVPIPDGIIGLEWK